MKMHQALTVFLAFAGGVLPVLAQVPFPAPANRAVVPAARLGNKTWTARHNRFLEEAKKGDIDLLFVGDSLTANWEKYPELWKKKFGKFKAANFGIGGDQTEHLLYRLQSGELDGIQPKVVVLLIGTNNMSKSLKYTPEQIAEGAAADIREIQKHVPEATILLVSIFPREIPLDDWLNVKNADTNAFLRKLADGKKVVYVDLWNLFRNPDGTVSKDFYADRTHINERGYERYADALLPEIKKFLQVP